MKKIAFLALMAVIWWVVPAGAKMMSIAKDKVNIRAKPSLQAEVLFQAPLGYPIQVKTQKGQWINFKDWVGDSGWVHRPLVSQTHTVVITGSSVNVRRGPSLKDNVAMQANKGDIFKVLKKKGKWVQVGYYYGGDVIGWIRQDMIWGE